ncbi:hypothetical protein WJX72_004561 [[Myrmecia] bisecta]|uniref:thioredoxin-dependent peroxiredoxin n=1 Tax=[Myrmecia] bisecta TaxID=41462 RepID=A0AAW1QQG0_9CHLO
MGIELGSQLQDYSKDKVLKTADGTEINLSSLIGQVVVVFFYPKADTAVCTKEACGFRDNYSAFKDCGATVLGISSDTPEANAKWAKAQRLPFPLASDPGGELRKAWGIKGGLLGLVPGRETLVFDKSGKCVFTERSALNAGKHVNGALKVIQELSAGK